MSGYLVGIDVGSSSVKVSLVEAESGKVTASSTSPSTEMEITARKAGWAEQHPDLWWKHLKSCLQSIGENHRRELAEARAVGIAYQMHGLVAVDKDKKPLRDSIIWCDSRAVDYGNTAFSSIGSQKCYSHLLNSPGNFTASKLAWVKENEPELFSRIDKIMLPGEYIALCLTGEAVTTASGLSEGIMWDVLADEPASFLLDYFGIPSSLLSTVKPLFGEQGYITASAAEELGLPAGIPVAYRAGDQPNNAFSLNVLNPGEAATTAGTSGVVYGVTDQPSYDPLSRVNTFVHVNHSEQPRYGVLLCLNGTGSLNQWLKRLLSIDEKAPVNYELMNELAASVEAGAADLRVYPYGNGAERTLENRNPGGAIENLNFNIHSKAHVLRAAQEGIVYALYYGMEIMRGMGMDVSTVKAGRANMFLSPLFRQVFATVTGATVELYNTDGAIGAARGAGVGAGIYTSFNDAFSNLHCQETVEPDAGLINRYAELYSIWKKSLEQKLI